MKTPSTLTHGLILTLILLFIAFACKKEENENPPEGPLVSTETATAITQNSASCSGNVTSEGSSAVVTRGICWSSSHYPSLTDSKKSEGNGSGSFSCAISGLNPNTIYYYRAYAINATDTAFGSVKSFTTLQVPVTTVTDVDGNEYHMITIGNQTWLKENLRTTHYNNNQVISKVEDDGQWGAVTTGAWCDYNNDAGLGNIYGHLYNFKAVTNTAKLCPSGWHVPTDGEWIVLAAYLGGEDLAGGKLKESGTTHWNAPNTGATNESGFTALPGGTRDYLGTYLELRSYGHWWSSTPDDATSGWSRRMGYTYPNIGQSSSYEMNGFSVRCIKD